MENKKLWAKDSANQDHLEIIEKFTVGKDKDFDVLLAQYDIFGTKAHCKMLAKIGFLTDEENDLIQKELDEMYLLAKENKLFINDGVEDIHSQIEFNLTQKLGDAGKKIHTGRSRNDQVLLAIKLYLSAEIKEIAKLSKILFERLITLADTHQAILMPGYTHFQIGMPSSFGLWFSAYAESLSEDLEVLAAALSVTQKNPLGSGAGFGSSFPLDRDLTTKELNLGKMNINSVYAQMTRGKSEKITAMAMSTMAATLGKLAYDICMFSNQNYGFITFPPELTTGSSIMPHKKNPDVFELIRAKSARIQSLPNELTLLTNNLPSGYHRDFQLTKEILFPGIQDLKDCLIIFQFMLKHLLVKEDILKDEKYDYLFSVEKINELVQQGHSFREAYREVGNSIENGSYNYRNDDLKHTHKGSMGNLCLDEISDNFREIFLKFK
ncbi:argininosuccinate lyase [Chryseobacterium sp. 6424]|uniref:argininosuccinate lyase n=1 Tax=Chryseobacterium sp. 6424 TaxID=2039166 RepID=UPI000EFA89DE|nr:argininosuccinate lyase [Chryseobacterium sp. 6424]AYO57675.1 argininosuccinate lyase [Chryseobacterium sp. 6424]